MPALKLHAVARDLSESIVRAKIAPDRVVACKVGESTLLWLCGIKVRTVRQLSRSERRLIQQNAAGADTRQFLAFRHAIGNLAPLSLSSARGNRNHDSQQHTQHSSSTHKNTLFLLSGRRR